ncbi:hypothetical protein LCGC14_3009420, partial [marine sediment metagenome]
MVEWIITDGLTDYRNAEALNKEYEGICKKFVASLKAVDPGAAAALADDALA